MAQHMSAKRKTKEMIPDPQWLQINGQVATVVNDWAARPLGDLMVKMGSTAGGPTAFFDPKMGQIEINTDVAFGEHTKPEEVGDLRERKNQFEWPKATGAVFHESAHAKYTTWDLYAAARTLSEKENDAMHVLEESRCERQLMADYPKNKPFLRSCILEIVLNDMSDADAQAMNGTRQAAHLCALALARVDTGVLKKKDVRALQTQIEKVLEPKVLSQLREIWREFQNINDPSRNLERMYELARKWAAILDEAAKQEDEDEQRAQEIAEAMAEAMQQLGGQAGQTEIDAQSDVHDQQSQERREAAQKEKDEKRKEQQKNKDSAKKVFKKNTQQHHNSGGQLEYKETLSGLTETRAPLPEEAKAAVLVSKALEKAKYHDRVRIEKNSIIPPGRLRTRSAVQNAAYRSQNVRIDAEPFRRVQRKHTVDPNLTVGIMTDISGSMSAAMTPMGVTGWVISEAVRKIQGKYAMVNYGYDVTPVLYPNQKSGGVRIYDCPDGSEAFDLGFRALDGELELLAGTGARLLVIVSDGNYKSDENDHAKRWLKRCREQGVAVLWVGYGNPYGAQEHIKGTDAQLIIPGKTAAEVAQQIGKAAVDALNKAGQANS